MQVFERMLQLVTHGRTPSASMRECITAIASIAYRYFQNGVVLRTVRNDPDSSTDHKMTNSPLTAFTERSAPNRRDRIRSWIARLLSQPVVRQISQTTEWDNDVPPFPILAGAVARA